MNAPKMNRRKFLGMSLATATGVGLAACAQAPRAGGPVVVTQVVEKVITATPSGPKQGGVVATYIGADPPGLDPCNPWNLGSGFGGLMGLVYEPWLTRDRALKLQPGLAKSWSQSDATTAVFEIQPGVKYHSSGMLRLNVNWLREPLKDENVRLAINYGVNRKQMVDTLTNGLGQNSGPVAPSNTLFALPQDEVDELQKFDPDLAIEYMKKAGYDLKDNRLRLDCLSIAGFKNFTDVAQIVAANLKEIGIDVEIRIQEIGVWVDSRIDKKDYDLSINDYGHGPEPDFTFYRSDKTEQEWTGGGLPELDKLIDAANAEPDEQKRVSIIQDIQRMIITKVREVYLYAPPIFEVAAKNFVGYEPWPGGTDFRVFDRDQVYWAG